MLNKPSIKIKLPYASGDSDLLRAFNFMVKTINSSFNTQDSVEQLDPKASLLGVEFEQSYSSGSGAFAGTYTFNHNIGSIPSGFIIIDNVHPAVGYGDSFTRVSWTTTQITIKISVDTGIAAAFSGSFKILVLR